MTDHPMLFSGPMVCAQIKGLKTETRRLMKLRGHKDFSEFQPSDTRGFDWCFRDSAKRWHDITHEELLNRYLQYKVGDRIWVKETWRIGAWHGSPAQTHKQFAVDYPANDCARKEWLECSDPEMGQRLFDQTLGECEALNVEKWEPGESPLRIRRSIFMPRWASRITLTVTDVRVEQLQDISSEDARAEGLSTITKDGKLWKYGIPDREGIPGTDDHGWPWREWEREPTKAFAKLWDSINAKRGFGWDTNPWVVALTFDVHRVNIDQMAEAG